MKALLTLACSTLILAACAGSGSKSASVIATASLVPTAGNAATGKVLFTERDGEVIATAEITGLKPGLHGFHIHEKGDCSAPDASSAGGHFNPDGSKPHGGVAGAKRHAGDMGNLSADADGKARYEGEVEGVTLAQGASSIIGRAVVIHADADDMKTQPSGNAGSRVACGVISLK